MSIINIAKDEALVAEAYERVKGEMAALSVEELVLPNLDVQFAVRTILGSLPEIRTMREQMMKALPLLDIATVDKLEDYTLALSRAHAQYQIATQPPDELEHVFAEGSKHRELLVASAKALALVGLFDPRKIDQLKHGNGYGNVAQDLQALSAAYEEGWAKIEGKTVLTLDDVKAASRVGLRLTRLVGLREQGTALLAEATENRRRAFTLVSRAYDEVREAVIYLRRRENDADTIAPTLYPGKARRPAVEEPTNVPAGSVPAPAAAGVPGAPALSPATAAPTPTAPSVPAGSSAQGPFVS